ncbi:hypothetical protein [Nocardioides euryhalodurans]|nr:hypothetical protein [Nocardioides euryhalodurans]
MTPSDHDSFAMTCAAESETGPSAGEAPTSGRSALVVLEGG